MRLAVSLLVSHTNPCNEISQVWQEGLLLKRAGAEKPQPQLKLASLRRRQGQARRLGKTRRRAQVGQRRRPILWLPLVPICALRRCHVVYFRFSMKAEVLFDFDHFEASLSELSFGVSELLRPSIICTSDGRHMSVRKSEARVQSGNFTKMRTPR